MPITPEGQQVEALQLLKQWWANTRARKAQRPFFALYGFAGTGKTSIVRFFLEDLRLDPSDVSLMTFTGKAARVLSNTSGLDASTIHSNIYKMQRTPTGHMAWTLDLNSPVSQKSLFILDECSQIGKQMFADLLSFGIPMIILGDPGQLPPINDLDIINSTPPDIFLTQIHRQALDNPIIYLSKLIRDGGDINFGQYGDLVKKIRKEDLDLDELHETNMVLVGRNTTRSHINGWYRNTAGRQSPIPEKGERIICLKNQRKIGLFNGMIGNTLNSSVETIDPHTIKIDIMIEDDETVYPGQPVLRDQFQPVLGDDNRIVTLGQDGYPVTLESRQKANLSQFVFAYSITTHKAQGSQWDHIILFDEWTFRDRTKWLYTGVTRAIKKLTILA